MIELVHSAPFGIQSAFVKNIVPPHFTIFAPMAYGVVIDERIIACSGPGTAIEVAFLLIGLLMGPQTVRDVRHYMLF